MSDANENQPAAAMESKEESKKAEPKIEESKMEEPKKEHQHLLIMEEVGDIFDAPENSVLIHACNSLGEWGAGIASAFQTRYPNAYKEHLKHCESFPDGIAPTGTAQLIPPVAGDSPRHYIGCLFTSVRFGNARDDPGTILKNTGPAMLNLLRQIADIKKEHPVGEIRIARINSGLFHVPWPSTEAVLNDIDLEDDMPTEMTMFQRPT